MSKYTIATTREQRVALKRLFDRTPLVLVRRNGTDMAETGTDAEPPFLSYRAFRKRVCHGPFHKSDPYVSVWWCGMMIGVEKDGHTHS